MNGDPKRRASLARVMGYVEQVRLLFTWAGVPTLLQTVQVGLCMCAFLAGRDGTSSSFCVLLA